ncbi:hypothetical protein [Streptomyces lavendofoliae]|uniref:hypothetical protein n=1 Tax=Streptomyces lavendofoliae TaxID=67314 RepID=UPI00300ED839
MPVEIHQVRTDVADAWVAWDGDPSKDYAYGGCRLVGWRTGYEDAVGVLCALMRNESGYKNALINLAVEEGALDDLSDALPPGFTRARVGGGRCIIRPASAAVAAILEDPQHPEFRDTILRIFEPLGELLNSLDGKVKLTPDFGKFAGVSDLLHEFTPHVLGIHCDSGGCGGKASYSATGVTAAYETLEFEGLIKSSQVTLIGSAGAMGTTVLADLIDRTDRDLTVCDLKYDDGSAQPPAEVPRLTSVPDRFPDEALSRSSTVIATTWGHELQRSNHSLLQPGTVLLLAHNLAIPTGVEGIELMRQVSRPDILVVPGQTLTFGGALTSRLEWFSRQAGITAFDKPLAHQVVRRVAGHWARRLTRRTNGHGNPYEELVATCEPLVA